MNSRSQCLVGILLMLVTGAVVRAHPGHTSVGEGRFDPQHGRLLLAIEVDAMHLEQEAGRDRDRAVDLDDRTTATPALRRYVAAHLALRIGEAAPLAPRLVEWALEGMSGWLYVEFTLPDRQIAEPAVALRNTLLMTVRDQESLLTIAHEEERTSLRWSQGESAWQPVALPALSRWLTADRPPPPMVTLPASRGGQDLVGQRWPSLTFDAWFRGAPTPDATAPRVTLYRWWTAGCRFCRTSLPAIETLRDRYADHGLRTVAVFHPKPPRPVPADDVTALATSYDYDGPVALDEDWSLLRSFYLGTGRRRATSVTFLVDHTGTIRFVHPGPEFFPSSDPAHARAQDDFEALDQAIRALLHESRAADDATTDRPSPDPAANP